MKAWPVAFPPALQTKQLPTRQAQSRSSFPVNATACTLNSSHNEGGIFAGAGTSWGGGWGRLMKFDNFLLASSLSSYPSLNTSWRLLTIKAYTIIGGTGFCGEGWNHKKPTFTEHSCRKGQQRPDGNQGDC